MAQRDLGIVTAYGYAKAGGYTGTEAQFTEDLGKIEFPVPVSKGGTGSNTVAGALTNLGLNPVVVPLTESGMSLPSGVTLHSDNFIVAIGKICVVRISLKIVNKSGNTVIGNYFPAAYTPRYNFFATGDTGLGDGKTQSAIMNNDRSLSFWPTNSGTTYVIATGVYVAA